MIIKKKNLSSEQTCFLCVFRIVFICFHNSVWIYYLHLLHTCSRKQREGEIKSSFSLGMSCGSARGSWAAGSLYPLPHGTQQSCSAALSPLQNTCLEIFNRALKHLTCIGSKLNQLLLLSVLATKDKCSLFFIATFSYNWGLSSCSLLSFFCLIQNTATYFYLFSFESFEVAWFVCMCL